MKVEILGSVQDGGVPHLGANSKADEMARQNRENIKYVTSVLLKEGESNNSPKYLIEASPDIRYQVDAGYIDGVFIPHTGLGHVTGLLYFGKEGQNAQDLNVHTNKDVERFLMNNDPYRYLLDRENIEIQNLGDQQEMELMGGKITSYQYEHAALVEKTTGYMIEGESKKLFYLSDIDEINRDVKEKVKEADIAILDGTFYSKDEIERYEEVPHPTIPETMEKFSETDTEIYFIHMNHTNPVLIEDTEERQEVEERGFGVVEKGMEFQI